LKFDPKIAAKLRRSKLLSSRRRHLDGVVNNIAGERVWFWRAIDDGEVMDMLV